MPEQPYNELLSTVLRGEDLSLEQTRFAFDQIMGGLWSEAQIAGLLVALAAKGETADEIAGAAVAMREHVVPIDTGGREVVDTCGTGGTGLPTFNISTTTAFVLAGADVPVAKHGNRTNTRTSGSADVLAALGVNIDAPPETVHRCLAEAKVCFCFAVRCHPAMKYAVPVRKQLAVRTIFNMLGPLTNPAGARRQLLGVPRAELTERIAEVLRKLGAARAMVVHASDGLDEISITAETKVCDMTPEGVSSRTVCPEDFGLERATLDDLLVDSPERSAEVLRGVLAGRAGAPADIVALNAGAALVIAGKARDIPHGIEQARESVASGAAAAALEKLIDLSNAG